MRSILGREPAVIIGIAAAALWAAVSSLAGSGVIGTDIADTIGKAIDPAQGGWAIPIIVGIVTRFFVTSPVTAAKLQAEVPPGYVKAP